MVRETPHLLVAMKPTPARLRLTDSLGKTGTALMPFVSDADELLNRITASAPGGIILLLDENLSRQNGERVPATELIRQIKQLNPSIEIIIVSRDRQLALDALEAGALQYLLHPLNEYELLHVIHQAREIQQMRQAVHGKQLIESLLAASPSLLSQQEEEYVLEHILACVSQSGLDRVRLYLLSKDRRYLTGKAHAGMKNPDFVGVHWPVEDDAYLQQLIRNPRPHVFEREPGKPAHSEDALDKEGVKEWACIPLLHRGEVMGLISADNKYSQRRIIESELVPLALFADQASVAIENAHLHTQNRDKLSRLGKLYRAITEIYGDLREMTFSNRLALIAQRVAEILNAETCSVLLVREDGVLTLEAGYGYREGAFERGRSFQIVSGERVGMTGHLAAEGRLFNAHGEALTTHSAIRDHAPNHTPSGQCHSLLAAPLRKAQGQSAKLVGLLRADNKKSKTGTLDPQIHFTEEDELIIKIFAEAVVTAIEAGEWGEELQRQKKQKEMIVAHSPLAVILIDLQGNVLEFNARAEEIFGFSVEEVCGTKVHLLYADPEEPRHIGELLDRLHGEIHNHPTAVKSKDGEIVPISLSARWLYEGDQRVGSVGYFEDLRSLQAVEQRLDLFLKASEILTREQNLAAGLQRLAEMMVNLFPGTFCRILLFDESRQFLITEAACPLPRFDTAGLKWEPGMGQQTNLSEYDCLKDLLFSGKPQIISPHHPAARANLIKFGARLKFERPVQSLLIVPLIINNKVLGLLDLGEMCDPSQTHFKTENIELVAAIAAQISVLIDRIQMLEQSQLREKLWSALDAASEQVKASKSKSSLTGEIARQAAQLIGCQAGGVVVHKRIRSRMELQAGYGLSKATEEMRLPLNGNWLSEVLRKHSPQLKNENDLMAEPDDPLACEGFKSVYAIALRQPAGEPEAVLFVGDRTGQVEFTDSVQTILRRFAAHASLALHTAKLIEDDQHRINQISVLHQIRDFIQSCDDQDKILHAVLTGVTASYGLRFNRAMILLKDQSQHLLIGQSGIGQLSEQEAAAVWEQVGQAEFDDCTQYLARLKAQGFEPTAVGSVAVQLRYTLDEECSRVFGEVLRTRRAKLVAPSQLNQLPDSFVEKLQPETSVAVIPLIAKEQAIGLLIADNKFNRVSIGKEEINLLLSFAAVAATAAENLAARRQRQKARDTLVAFYQVSNSLQSIESPKRLLDEIVRETCRIAKASRVRLMIVDHTGQMTTSLTHPDGLQDRQHSPNPPNRSAAARIDRYSDQVLRTGVARYLEDTSGIHGQLHGDLPETTRAAAVLPLSLPEKRIGTLWVHYDQPHNFTEFEKIGLQLFVNQVAIAFEHTNRIEQLERARKAGEELAGASSTTEVLNRIVTVAKEVFKSEVAAIWFYDAEENTHLAEPSAAAGMEPEIWERHRKLKPKSRGTVYQVMQRGWLPLDLDDPEQLNILGERSRQFVADVQGKVFLGLALKVGEEKLGALYLIYKQPQNFSEERHRVALSFVNQAALALKKARLLDQLKLTQKAVETVARVSPLGNRQATLRSIVKKVRDSLRCEAVVLFECDPKTGMLFPQPTMIGVNDQAKVNSPNEVKDHDLPKEILQGSIPRFVREVMRDPAFRKTRFAREEKIQSCAAIPLRAAKRNVGVMFVNYRRPHYFTEADRDSIRLLSTQAGASLGFVQLVEEHAQIIEEHRRNIEQYETLHEAGKASAGSFGLDRKQVLNQLLKQAVESIAAQHANRTRNGRRSGQQLAEIIGTIQFYDAESQILKFAGIYPPEYYEKIKRKVGTSWSLDRENTPLGRIGITGRTILDKKSQRIPDVSQDKDYLIFNPGTKSELSVPLLNKGEVIGAINVESNQVGGLDNNDQKLLEALADFAVSTINIEELHQQFLISNEIARIGMASSTWEHTMISKAQAIKENADLLRSQFRPETLPEKIETYLARIEEACRQLLEKPIIAPLSSEQDVKPELIYNLVLERIKWLCAEQYTIACEFDPACDKTAVVKVSAAWLTRAIDILVDNATKAMENTATKKLTVSIARQENKVSVTIADTGTGIPKHLAGKLLREPITKEPGEKGKGIGLMLARLIIKTYGGDIRHKPNSPTGTRMIFWLPAEDAE